MPLALIIILILIWIVATTAWQFIVVRWIHRRLNGRPATFFAWLYVRLHARLVHRVRHHGLEHVPRTFDPGPLIVVSNHTGSIDPFLIQAACPFLVRWLMGRDMMSESMNVLWNHVFEVIPVDRDKPDARSARKAMRLLKDGKQIGVFPEGRIVDPPRQIWPFRPGVGLMIKRTKAPVLLVWVHGTPDTTNMWPSLLTPSRSEVHFLGMFEFDDDQEPEQITETLRQKIAEVSGWPLNDNPPEKVAPLREDAPGPATSVASDR